MAGCQLHCFDLKLFKEWSNTCGEYFPFVGKPFSNVKPKDLFKCQQSDWDKAFTEWTVIQFYCAIVMAVVNFILGIVLANTINITAVIQQIVLGYFFAHLAWFGVVKRPNSKGCCCCLVVCWQCQGIILCYAILCIAWGAWMVVSAVFVMGLCPLCFLLVICPAIYAIVLIYMGLCAFNIWQGAGQKEVVGKGFEVDGPNGEVIGKV